MVASRRPPFLGKYLSSMLQSNQSFRAIIKNPGFVNLWINQILVQLCYNALNFSLIIWVFLITKSDLAVSFLMFCIFLPAVLLGMFAGVFVDIYNRKKIIIIVNLGLAAIFIGLFFFKSHYSAILILAFLVNTLSQLYSPAESSAIPMIVPKHQLLSANSLFSITLFSTFLLGFGLAGPLIDVLSISAIFLIGASILFLAAILALFFPNNLYSHTDEASQIRFAIKKRQFTRIITLVITEIKSTFQVISKQFEVVFAIAIMAGVQVIIAIMAVVVPGFLETVVHINATNASYVLVIPLGVGMILGGLLIGKFGNKFPKRMVVGTAILTAGLIFLLGALAPIFSPAIKYLHLPTTLPFFYQIPLSTVLAFGAFLLGVSLVAISVPAQTVIQEYTSDHTRGKVFALLSTIMAATAIIPVLLVGTISQFFGSISVFMILGVIITFLGILALRPSLLISENWISSRLKSFLGQGHWGN